MALGFAVANYEHFGMDAGLPTRATVLFVGYQVAQSMDKKKEAWIETLEDLAFYALGYGLGALSQ